MTHDDILCGRTDAQPSILRLTLSALTLQFARLPFRDRKRITRAFAKRHGFTGRAGGWIYDRYSRPQCQGWDSFAKLHLALIAYECKEEILAAPALKAKRDAAARAKHAAYVGQVRAGSGPFFDSAPATHSRV